MEHVPLDESLFRAALDNLVEGVVVHDATGRIVWVNRAAERLLGLSVDELTGRTWVDPRWPTGHEESYGAGWSTPFHPEDRERALEAWRQATATGGTYELEVRLRRSDGVYRWWLVRGSPFRDEGGAITKWVGTCTDIEDLRQARSGLELSAANYDALFDATLLGTAHGEMVLDDLGRPVDYRFLRVNGAFEEMTGLTREDVVGRTIREIVPGFEDSAFDFIGVHGTVALTGEPVEFEQYREHLGRWYAVHLYSPRRGEFISMFSDITKRKRDEEALRESEYLFAASQQAAHVGTWSWKVGDATTYWSDETYRIYGLSPEMGPPSYEFFFEILHPDDHQKAREFPAAVITGLQPPPFDSRVRRPDGTYRWIRTAGDVVETVDGAPSRIAGTAYDVTERKRAEELLAQKTRLYATLSQINQTIVRVKEPAELYQSICDVAVEFGAFSLAWVGLHDEDSGDVRPVAAHGVDVAKWPFEMVNTRRGIWKDGLVATAIRSGEVAFTGDLESNETLRSLLGQTEGRDDHSIAAIPFGPNGKPVGVLVLVSQRDGLFEEASETGLLQEVGLDISFALDSMATEVALRESEEQLERIGEMAKFGGWELDLQTLEVSYSRETARIHEVDWPYIPPTLSQGNEYYPPEAWEIVQAAVQAAIEHGTPYDLESPFITAKGRQIWVRVQGSRVMQDGKAIKLQGSFQDITERKTAETARAALQAQLDQAQKLESVGRLAGGVAHDFNNMLAVILGNTDLALEALGPSHPARADLLEVREAAGRSSHLTRQLLAFARRETAAPKVLDLNVLVSAMLGLLRRLIGEDIELVWKPGHDLSPVFVDPSQVDQVLANLVVNARDAISDVGMISIETGIATLDAASVANQPDSLPGDYVVLTVSDTGSGMDAETIAHMYEPFFTTKEISKGTGLGLATVYGIARQNGGFLDASSEVGVGTTFRIYLPRHLGPLVPPEAPAPSIGDGDGGETVLLVEDEPALLRLSTVMLERLSYRVIAAATPGEALRLAREHPGEIQLLMTDVVMPQMNGRDLARNLQSQFPNLGTLFMSGYTADVIAHHGVLAEGVHFLQKPFSTSDLAVKVREALDAVPTAGDPPAG